MPAPDIQVTTQLNPVGRGRATPTGAAGIIGLSRTGPVRILTRQDRITSHDQWVRRHGGGSLAAGRQPDSVDYDVVETLFRDKGSNGLALAELYYSRVVGPNPVRASINLAGTGTTLVVTADEYGDLANTYRVQVANGPSGGTHRVIRLLPPSGSTPIAETPEFSDRAAVNGVKLGAGSPVPVTITLGGGSGPPTVAAAATLAGGTDDRANITPTQIQAALDRLDEALGPINVAAPNWGTAAVGLQLAAHAAKHHRFACADTVDTTNKSTVLAHAATLRADTNRTRVKLIHPWVPIPALATGGTPRSVPGSALQLARWASTDANPKDGPNQAAAGRWGRSSTALGVNATYSRVDLDELADAGVTIIRPMDGVVTIMDNLTLADPNGPDADLVQSQTVRYLNYCVARFVRDASDNYFAKINRDNLATWATQISGHLLADFGNGDLFPDDDDPRPETAFHVDTGGTRDTGPNSAATMNAGQMNALVGVRPVKGARLITIGISVSGMTQPVT